MSNFQILSSYSNLRYINHFFICPWPPTVSTFMFWMLEFEVYTCKPSSMVLLTFLILFIHLALTAWCLLIFHISPHFCHNFGTFHYPRHFHLGLCLSWNLLELARQFIYSVNLHLILYFCSKFSSWSLNSCFCLRWSSKLIECVF